MAAAAGRGTHARDEVVVEVLPVELVGEEGERLEGAYARVRVLEVVARLHLRARLEARHVDRRALCRHRLVLQKLLRLRREEDRQIVLRRRAPRSSASQLLPEVVQPEGIAARMGWRRATAPHRPPRANRRACRAAAGRTRRGHGQGCASSKSPRRWSGGEVLNTMVRICRARTLLGPQHPVCAAAWRARRPVGAGCRCPTGASGGRAREGGRAGRALRPCSSLPHGGACAP